MKRNTKIVIIVAAIIGLILLASVFIPALTTGATKGFIYTPVNDGTAYELTDGTSYFWPDLEIPSEYEGLPVTRIGNGAFERRAIVNLVIPDTVTEIGKHAFRVNDVLETVVIPSRATLPSLHPQNNYCTL